MSDLKKLPSSIEPDVLDQFGVIVGRSNVLTDMAECIAYGYDNSKLQAIPQAVLLPESDEQLEIIIGLCRQQHIPVIARGRGTGTTGATSTTGAHTSFAARGLLNTRHDARNSRGTTTTNTAITTTIITTTSWNIT